MTWHKLKWYYGPIISVGRGLMCKPCCLCSPGHPAGINAHSSLPTVRRVSVCMHANEMFKEMRGRGWEGGWNEVITWKWDKRQNIFTVYHQIQLLYNLSIFQWCRLLLVVFVSFHVTFLNTLLVARAPGVSPYMLHVQSSIATITSKECNMCLHVNCACTMGRSQPWTFLLPQKY